MKDFGGILLIAGLALIIYALSIDTSVKVNYPGGNNFGMPERVNNIGLMNDKQNYLIFAGIISVLGVLILVSGKKPEKNIVTEDDTKQCPQCAEKVKAEAKICRFCNHVFVDDVYMTKDLKIYTSPRQRILSGSDSKEKKFQGTRTITIEDNKFSVELPNNATLAGKLTFQKTDPFNGKKIFHTDTGCPFAISNEEIIINLYRTHNYFVTFDLREDEPKQSLFKKIFG